MNTPPAAPAAGASACDVLVISGGPAGSTAAALPAGDVFGDTPIHGPLLLFKGMYYAASLLDLKRTSKALRMRRHDMRVTDETGMATS
jgi:hypothetical protein